MFSSDVLESIKIDAMQRYPRESCGVIIDELGVNRYVALPNVAAEPETSFHIDESSLVPYLDKIEAIVHSHPDGPDCPSEADMRQQVAWQLPFGIVSTDGNRCLEPFWWGDTVPIPPLVGRGFRHGVTDCYALVRDHFRLELGITLREYPRDWEWWSKDGQRLYEDYFEVEGFNRIETTEVKLHDCFLAQIRSNTPNHAGVYVGNSLILHHLTARGSTDPSRLSRREPVGGWQKFICGFWVRHESMYGA